MKKVMLFLTAVFLSIVFCVSLFARAGGGGGGEPLNPVVAFVLAPVIFFYGLFLVYRVNKKSNECSAILAELEKKDSLWGMDSMRGRVEEVFFAVQQAWEERDQDMAKNHITPRLYKKHKAQTDDLKKKKLINVLDNKNLVTMDIVHVSDYLDDSKDMFWAYLEGSMYDYYVNEETKKVVRGSAEKKEHFCELWKFIRVKNQWMLDEIDQSVSTSKIKAFRPFSESLKKTLMSLLFIAGLAAVFFILGQSDLLARAGGGGRSGGGGIVMLVLWPVVLIYSAIIGFYVNKKNGECEEILRTISKYDPVWKKEELNRRIKDTFFAVQKAWMLRDQDLAREYMTDRIYRKHKTQTDELIKKHRINQLDNIELLQARLVQVADHKDNDRDRMYVYIQGKMSDYYVNDINGEILDKEKDAKKPGKFSEIWKFVRQGNEWMLDEIDQKVSISSLKNFRPFSWTGGKG